MNMHISLDIETLSTNCNAVILSVAAVKFDIDTDQIISHYYSIIDMNSTINNNFHIDPDTIKWWMTQNENAKKIFFTNEFKPLQTVLIELSRFCLDTDILPEGVWGNGAVFDNGILKNAFESLNMKLPWSYKKDCDLRTLKLLSEKLQINWYDNVEFIGEQHNALDDAIYQAHVISYIWNNLTKK